MSFNDAKGKISKCQNNFASLDTYDLNLLEEFISRAAVGSWLS
jgi:hypothetical protein